jgi:hypothetical protein
MGLLIRGEGPARLLTSPGAFSHLRELELDDNGETWLVKPAGAFETTDRYEIFAVKGALEP